MTALNPAKVIRRVRQRLELSQEGLSRLLNATKGAVQHWERGRNHPDLARLLALRPLCPAGAERKELDALIRQRQARATPFPSGKQGRDGAEGEPAFSPARLATASPLEALAPLRRRENHLLHRQLERLEARLKRRTEQLRILRGLAIQLQRELDEVCATYFGESRSTSETELHATDPNRLPGGLKISDPAGLEQYPSLPNPILSPLGRRHIAGRTR